jgi:hypothetical protein
MKQTVEDMRRRSSINPNSFQRHESIEAARKSEHATGQCFKAQSCPLDTLGIGAQQTQLQKCIAFESQATTLAVPQSSQQTKRVLRGRKAEQSSETPSFADDEASPGNGIDDHGSDQENKSKRQPKLLRGKKAVDYKVP